MRTEVRTPTIFMHNDVLVYKHSEDIWTVKPMTGKFLLHIIRLFSIVITASLAVTTDQLQTGIFISSTKSLISLRFVEVRKERGEISRWDGGGWGVVRERGVEAVGSTSSP